ncbi:MAG: hypothetical protein HQL03_03530 [Nitrospirae bacterium]|nr:hypothetical protein [Nitrospirota bacterium]
MSTEILTLDALPVTPEAKSAIKRFILNTLIESAMQAQDTSTSGQGDNSVCPGIELY